MVEKKSAWTCPGSTAFFGQTSVNLCILGKIGIETEEKSMAVLGRRHWYRYDSDDGKSYRIQLLDYLAEAAGLELDDTLPLLPRNYKPRFLWFKEAEPQDPDRPLRKKLIFQKKEDFVRLRGIIEVAG